MKQELACWPHWEAIGLNLTSRRFYSAQCEREKEEWGGACRRRGVKRVDSKISTCPR